MIRWLLVFSNQIDFLSWSDALFKTFSGRRRSDAAAEEKLQPDRPRGASTVRPAQIHRCHRGGGRLVLSASPFSSSALSSSFLLPHVFFLNFLTSLSNHVQSHSDVQSARLKRVVGASLHIITTSLSLKCFLVFEEKKSALSPGSHLI